MLHLPVDNNNDNDVDDNKVWDPLFNEILGVWRGTLSLERIILSSWYNWILFVQNLLSHNDADHNKAKSQKSLIAVIEFLPPRLKHS